MALKLDINAAINHLNAHSSASSKHQCARYVRMALEAGGLSTAGRPNAAKNYHLQGFLKKIGFQQYTPQYGGEGGYQTINAQPGDIEVQVYEPYGHICMYNGSIWVSDFRQAQASASKSRQGQQQYYYRFTGEIDNSTPLDAGGSSESTNSAASGGNMSGSGNGIVKLKINMGRDSRGDYPANAKLTKQGWEVRGQKKRNYDPYESLQTYKTVSEKTEKLTTTAPSKENYNKTVNNISDLTTELIKTPEQILSEMPSQLSDQFITTLATGKIDINDYKDIIHQTSLNVKSLWEKNPITGMLDTFGFNCPVCGKRVKYIPINGYCSLNCFISDMETQLLTVKNHTVAQLKEFTESNMQVVSDYIKTVLSVINDLPDAIKEIEDLPDKMKSYLQVQYNYIANRLKIQTDKILIWKNKLLIAWLVEYMNGVCAKDGLNEPVQKSSEPETSTETAKENEGTNKEPNDISKIITDIQLQSPELINNILSQTKVVTDTMVDLTKKLQVILQYTDKFYEIYDTLYDAINQIIQLVVPSDSFGFSATTRARIKNPAWLMYVDISCPCSASYSLPKKRENYKSENKAGATRPKVEKIKKMVDKIINYSFPPITEYEYLLDPQVFAVRLIMSDQNVVAIAKNIKTLFKIFRGSPDLLPKYEEMTVINLWYMYALIYGIVPTIQFNYGKIAPSTVEGHMPPAPPI